jgi:hypothetical protein
MIDPITPSVASGKLALRLRVVEGLSNLAEKVKLKVQDSTSTETDAGRV